MLHHFTIPLAVYESSSFSLPLWKTCHGQPLILAILLDVKWYLIVILICTSFHVLLDHICLWKNVYSNPLLIFRLSFLFIAVRILFILETTLFSDRWFTNFSCYFVSCLFHILHGVLWSTKMLNFDEFQFIYFFFYHTFSIMSKKLLPNPRS